MGNIEQFWQEIQQQKGIGGFLRRRLLGRLMVHLIDVEQQQESLQEQLEYQKQVQQDALRTQDVLRGDFEQSCVNLRNNNAALSTLQSNLDCVKVQIRQLERQPRQAAAPQTEVPQGENIAAPVSAPSSSQTYDTIEYFDFENHFRGSVEQIKEAQRQYLPYFRGKHHVLDLGCGRGEFLSLMQEEHIPAEGVDLYEPYADYCTMQGLQAACGDGIAYLQEMEQVDGIFVGQVVEHLTPEQILTLCRVAYEKLEEGGCIVIETPNPTSLSIYTNAFYIDPSHVKPVHPLTMEYYLEKTGFSKMELLYPESSKPAQKIPELVCPGENVAEFNAAVQEVARMLYGSQDYAVIAYK
jgi:O-antigen chain-terminating methyltransferase